VLLRLFEVVERRAQERVGSPFQRRDDFFVVIEAGGVFHRDDGMGAERERQGAPEPLPGWLAQSIGASSIYRIRRPAYGCRQTGWRARWPGRWLSGCRVCPGGGAILRADGCEELAEPAPDPGRGEMVVVIAGADDLAVADAHHEDGT